MTDIDIGIIAYETFTEFVTTAPTANPVSNSDYIPVIQGGVTKKLPATQAGGNTVRIITAGSTYAVQADDDFIGVAKSAPGIITITLPASPVTGRQLEIADCAGNAATYPITINGNGKNIDGAATYLMPFDWQSARLTYTGTIWKMG